MTITYTFVGPFALLVRNDWDLECVQTEAEEMYPWKLPKITSEPQLFSILRPRLTTQWFDDQITEMVEYLAEMIDDQVATWRLRGRGGVTRLMRHIRQTLLFVIRNVPSYEWQRREGINALLDATEALAASKKLSPAKRLLVAHLRRFVAVDDPVNRKSMMVEYTPQRGLMGMLRDGVDLDSARIVEMIMLDDERKRKQGRMERRMARMEKMARRRMKVAANGLNGGAGGGSSAAADGGSTASGSVASSGAGAGSVVAASNISDQPSSGTAAAASAALESFE